MDFQHSIESLEYLDRLKTFMSAHVYPNEERYRREIEAGDRWEPLPIIEELKAKARSEGLWNLFLPDVSGLSNVDYAPLAEEMGRVYWSSEVFNCSAPDTGNMEVLHLYGSEPQKDRWLRPLLEGEIRSCFAMTEPAVASSDATNIEASISKDGDRYVVNGRKWWSTGAMDRRCRLAIFMGKTDPDAPKYRQQSMILVPMDAEGVKIERHLTVFGYDDAPNGHAEMTFDNVAVPAENIILGEGRGFEIAQGRLGPGRAHHCMRLIGLAERALELVRERAETRVAFGGPLSDKGVVREWIARSRIEIEQSRLLVMKTAWMMDTRGSREARKEIAMIKAAVPETAMKIVDRAIQLFGGAGLSADHPLAFAYAVCRMLRIADGPDEVHLASVGKMELENPGSKE